MSTFSIKWRLNDLVNPITKEFKAGITEKEIMECADDDELLTIYHDRIRKQMQTIPHVGINEKEFLIWAQIIKKNA